MLYTYNELLNIYKTRHKVKKALSNGAIFKIEWDIYSDLKKPNYLDVITKKYPKAIFTLESAYYFYDLTDVIPRKEYLAVEVHHKVRETDKIKFYYTKKDLHELGITKLFIQGATINIYDKEKLLIELIRNKNNFEYDYYKEIINNYREIAYKLDLRKIEDYLEHYSNKKSILSTLQDEVY